MFTEASNDNDLHCPIQVHYVIKEFLSGDAGGDFSATVYVDTYQKHMASLDKIKKKKAAYHALMANLYTHCRYAAFTVFFSYAVLI